MSITSFEGSSSAKPTDSNQNTEFYVTSPTATASSGGADLHDEHTTPGDAEDLHQTAVTKVTHKINPNSFMSSMSTRKKNTQKTTSDVSKDTKSDRQTRKNHKRRKKESECKCRSLCINNYSLAAHDLSSKFLFSSSYSRI